MSLKIKSVGVDPKLVKAGPEDGLEEGEFIVYPSTFTREPDAYGDVVHPKAFDATLDDWLKSGNVLPGLYGHRMDDPDYFVAYALEMGTDHHGWWVKGRFDLENPKAATTYRLVKGRRLSQLSFAYDVEDEELVDLPDGRKANELRRVKVYEFSFVPVGANQDTSVVAIKGAVEQLRSNTAQLQEKAGRVLSAKNLAALTEARDAIDKVLADAGAEREDEDLEEADSSTASDQGEASGPPASSTGASDEEGSGPKSSAPEASSEAKSSVDALVALLKIRSRTYES